MFGLIGNVVKAVVNTVTIPVSIIEDIGNSEIAPRTERKVESIIDNVADVFNPSKW